MLATTFTICSALGGYTLAWERDHPSCEKHPKFIFCLGKLVLPPKEKKDGRSLFYLFFFFSSKKNWTQLKITPQVHPTFAKSRRQNRQGNQDENFLLGRKKSGQINKVTQMFFIKSARQHAHITDFQTSSFRLSTQQVEKKWGLNHPVTLSHHLCSQRATAAESTPVFHLLQNTAFPTNRSN